MFFPGCPLNENKGKCKVSVLGDILLAKHAFLEGHDNGRRLKFNSEILKKYMELSVIREDQ